jgi:hypothetical protein
VSATFNDWVKFGWLKEHRSSREEIANLFGLADRDLEACTTPGLVADWRFNIAYNAALQLAAAALAASSYAAERSNHHHRVIHSLELTIGLDSRQIQKFDLFRKKRNISDYERADTVSEVGTAEMYLLASDLRARVAEWIARKHSNLAP